MSQSWGFGIVRSSEWGQVQGPFEELCQLASAITGLHLVPVVASSYPELTAAILDDEVALAWLPPVPTIELEARGAATVLAIPARAGATTYHAALVVRAEGGPTTLAELRGRRAAWVQRDSAAGYLVPRMHLAAQGFDVLRFFTRELFVHSHGGVVDAVVSGEADVGATFCSVDPAGRVLRAPWLDDQGHATRAVTPLATMGPIPNDALVASTKLPEGMRRDITRWLLELTGRPVEIFQKLLGAGDFREPARDHYDVLRHALRTAHARGHESLASDSRMRMRVGR